MAIEWDTYEAILHRDGDTFRDRAINREIDMLKRRMLDSPATKSVKVEGIDKHMLVISTGVVSQKTFKMLPGDTIEIGDLVEWNGEHWLVTEVDFDDDLTRNGRIEQCNLLFRWQNGTPEIHYQWGIFDPGVFSTTIKEENKVARTDDQYRVYLSLTDASSKIFIGKRIITDVGYDKDFNLLPIVYEVTKTDKVSDSYGENGHLLIMNVRSGADYNPNTDNLDLMICDYIAPPEEEPVTPPPPTVLLPCSITGRDTLRAGLSARTYTVTFYLNDGVTEDPSVNATWDVVVPVGYENTIHYTANGNELSLSADSGAVGQTVILRAVDDAGLYEPYAFLVKVVASL